MLHLTDLLALFVILAAVSQDASGQEKGKDGDPLVVAFKAFEAAETTTKQAIIKEIARRVEASDDEMLRKRLEMISQAKRELKLVKKPPPEYYDPDAWAPGLYKRRFVDAESSDASMKRAIYRPSESDPPFFVRIEYDFGRNVGLDSGADPSPEDTLLNLLYGYPPGSDVLLAWLQKKWDFASGMDPMALHFAHVYCDLEGNGYADITIYDALASGEKLDMPDVDVIPYAKMILNDRSYVSPIPPTPRRERLYEKIKVGFLKYFQYKTWIEAAASLYVSPEAELRPEHRPLRTRLLYAFALEEGDVDKIRSSFTAARDRGDFIRQIDRLAIKDMAEKSKTNTFVASRNKVKWAVANIAHAVLREHGLLKDGE
jgi:hypothetical protein